MKMLGMERQLTLLPECSEQIVATKMKSLLFRLNHTNEAVR